MPDERIPWAQFHGNVMPCDRRVGWIIRTPRQFEAFLVRHGFSRRQARSICSSGFRGAVEGETADAAAQSCDSEERALELLRELAQYFGGAESLKTRP
jgi:hypothetical protein